MDLAGFKLIFFWEYFHRLWGRMLGLAFFIPLIYFWLKKAIPSGYHLSLIGLLCLGAFQGVVGWWMVTSGLVDNPAVSQYRLASHLSIALIIYGLLIWTGLNMMFGRVIHMSGHHIGTVLLLAITIIAGAFVAGMDAGLLYNEYPLMGEGLVPVEYGEKGVLDMFENPASAQFHHRWIAVLAALAVLTIGYRAIIRGFRKLGWLTIMMVICQFALGLTTLLMGVPVWAGALHQTGAVLLLAAVLVTIHALGRPGLKGMES